MLDFSVYRIISYDGKNVTFWYKSHETNEIVEETVTAQVFLGKLLMHIAPKYFKMVRLYGVYAGSISVKVRKCFGLLQYIKSGLKAIPDFVAFEYYTPEKYDKKSDSPIVMCIKCDFDIIIKR